MTNKLQLTKIEIRKNKKFMREFFKRHWLKAQDIIELLIDKIYPNKEFGRGIGDLSSIKTLNRLWIFQKIPRHWYYLDAKFPGYFAEFGQKLDTGEKYQYGIKIPDKIFGSSGILVHRYALLDLTLPELWTEQDPLSPLDKGGIYFHDNEGTRLRFVRGGGVFHLDAVRID